ncbi:MAG TPA: hypothetical protein VFQ75_13010 [Candidatus Limnocylindrales bacterium]|nr:hypothetical protein [Candidatus Limnocylindrales bacterium]
MLPSPTPPLAAVAAGHADVAILGAGVSSSLAIDGRLADQATDGFAP